MWDLWKEVKKQTGKEIVIQTPTKEIFMEILKKAKVYNMSVSVIEDDWYDTYKEKMCLRITGTGGYGTIDFYKLNSERYILVML